jgi:uncharacterized XkdX family phage protein
MGTQVINWFTTIQTYYNDGYYTMDQVASFVIVGKITMAQYQTITGQPFDGLAYFEMHFAQQQGTPLETEAQTYAAIAEGYISATDYTHCVSDAIYLYGTTSLTVIPTSYYVPVEQYAATTYTADQINAALTNGWITQQQFDETESYVPAS